MAELLTSLFRVEGGMESGGGAEGCDGGANPRRRRLWFARKEGSVRREGGGGLDLEMKWRLGLRGEMQPCRAARTVQRDGRDDGMILC